MVYKRHALGVHHVLLVGHLGCLAAIHEVRHVVHKHFEADTEQGVDVFLSARLRKSELQVSEVAQDQKTLFVKFAGSLNAPPRLPRKTRCRGFVWLGFDNTANLSASI